VREIRTTEKSIFLTFDDGPEPGMTEQVLDLLDTFQAKATFFVIAEKAKAHPALVREIQRRGHSIGNHSLDHRFSRYFGGTASILKWISESEDMIAQVIGGPTIGFRPPWGMRTPALKRVLEELKMPMILWNTRFYDAVFEWTPKKAIESLNQAQSGAILLLHDRQPIERMPLFLESLRTYVDAATQRGFKMRDLNRDLDFRAQLMLA
jgi:peptidoglycan/xylan/chitin deacetylase (PgdA/CDA1 family)